MKYFVFILLLSFSFSIKGQDSSYIKVHFLYGSKPKKKHKATEGEWFGGIHGGHVGIEYTPNKIIDFIPSGKFHYIEKKKDKNSKFVVHDSTTFWEIFGGEKDSMKKITFILPISLKQKKELDSVVKVYLNQTPYDYAFLGMRCAAASYDILSQIGITKKHHRKTTYYKNFIPKVFRKLMLKKAKQCDWQIIKAKGTYRREWEKD